MGLTMIRFADVVSCLLLEFFMRGYMLITLLSMMDGGRSSERSGSDFVQDTSEQALLCTESTCCLR